MTDKEAENSFDENDATDSKYQPPKDVPISELMQKDQDDPSLNEYKKKLLGGEFHWYAFFSRDNIWNSSSSMRCVEIKIWGSVIKDSIFIYSGDQCDYWTHWPKSFDPQEVGSGPRRSRRDGFRSIGR